MARFRSSAAVGAAGSTNVGPEPVRPSAPSPPVSRSSLFPSYGVLVTEPGTTNEGTSFTSVPVWQAAKTRHNGTVRFNTRGPPATASLTVERGGTEVNVSKRNLGLAVCCLDAEPARAGGPPARVRARRRPRLAAHAPPGTAAGRARAGAEDPRGRPAGDARRLALQEGRLLARSAGAGDGLGIDRAVGQLHGAAAPRARHHLRGRAPRPRSAQAGRGVAARLRPPRRGGAPQGTDAGGVAARRSGDHRVEPRFRADRAALRARAQRLRGRGGRGQGAARARAGLGAAVAPVPVRRPGLFGGGLRRQALARAAAWVTRSPPIGCSIHRYTSSITARSAPVPGRCWRRRASCGRGWSGNRCSSWPGTWKGCSTTPAAPWPGSWARTRTIWRSCPTRRRA